MIYIHIKKAGQSGPPSSGSMLEMQILRSHLTPSEWKILGQNSAIQWCWRHWSLRTSALEGLTTTSQTHLCLTLNQGFWGAMKQTPSLCPRAMNGTTRQWCQEAQVSGHLLWEGFKREGMRCAVNKSEWTIPDSSDEPEYQCLVSLGRENSCSILVEFFPPEIAFINANSILKNFKRIFAIILLLLSPLSCSFY